MLKKPPIISELTVDKSLAWKANPSVNLSVDSKKVELSLNCIHPYPDWSTLALLCGDSYKDKPRETRKKTPKDDFPLNWKRIWSVSSTRSGYFASIYANESAKQIVLAHRGTNPIKWKPLIADVAIFFNSISNQMCSAMTCSEQLIHRMNESFPGWQLIITGHSLGSYLADISTFSVMYLRSDPLRKVFCKRDDAEVYKTGEMFPYTNGIDGPGSFEMLLKLRDLMEVRYGKQKRMRVEDLPVDHYVAVPNGVNSLNKQVGGVFQIPIESSTWKETPIVGRLLKFFDNVTCKIPTHFLGNFISALDGREDVPINDVSDWPTNIDEMDEVNFNSKSDSRKPRYSEGPFAAERYQVKPINLQEVELRFFSDSVKRFLFHIDAFKEYTEKEMKFLLGNVRDETERELIVSKLRKIEIIAGKELVICREEGMDKQRLIPWLNRLFILYPNIIEKDNVIFSLYRHLFPHQQLLEFNCDLLGFDSISFPKCIEARDTSIATEEIVASLTFSRKKFLVLKTSKITLLNELFKLKEIKKNVDIVVLQQDTADLPPVDDLDDLPLIIIQHDKTADAAIVTCKVVNLTENCKNRLLATKIDFQGMEVTLNDCVSELNDAILPSLLQGGLEKIPKWIELDPSKLYFNLTLVTSGELAEFNEKIDEIEKIDVRDGYSKVNILGTLGYTSLEGSTPIDTVNKITSKIFVISDKGGAGKTTILTKLCPDLKTKDLWVIRVNLNERSKVIHEWAKRDTKIKDVKLQQLLQLLTELVSFDPSLGYLLQSVIQDEKSPVKICLLFDALDELVNYQLVIDLINRLQHLSKISKLIITTRPHLEDKFEGQFFLICPFSVEEQVEIIVKLMGDCSKDHSDICSLLTGYNWINLYATGTPMMLHILAAEFKEFKGNDGLDLNEHSIYERYIKRKIEEQIFVKEGEVDGSRGAEYKPVNYLDDNLKFYFHYAAKQILQMADNELKKDFGLEVPSEQKKNEMLSHGIVVGSDVFFEHKTFAEYFLAEWLMSQDMRTKAKPDKLAKIFADVIMSGNHYGVGLLMNSKIAGRETSGDIGISDDEQMFFKALAIEILNFKSEKRQPFLYHRHASLAQHMFDGLKKSCDQTTLQKILLSPCATSLLKDSSDIDVLHKVMQMYDDSGITKNQSLMSEILMNTDRGFHILHLKYDATVEFQDSIFRLVEKYLKANQIRELLLGNTQTVRFYRTSEELVPEALRWYMKYVTDDEMKDLIKADDDFYESVWIIHPMAVHKTLKEELKTDILNDLENIFKTEEKVWEWLLFRDRWSENVMPKMQLQLQFIYEEIVVGKCSSKLAEAFTRHICQPKDSMSDSLLRRAFSRHANMKTAYMLPMLLEVAYKYGVSRETIEKEFASMYASDRLLLFWDEFVTTKLNATDHDGRNCTSDCRDV